MAAQERHSAHLDAQALGEALGTRPATVRDVAYGEGQLYSAGRGAARLEVFPRSGVTRLTAQDLRVELFGTADAAVSDTGVEFHRSQPDQQASLTVIPGGGVVFTLWPEQSAHPPAPHPSRHPPHPSPPRHLARALRQPKSPHESRPAPQGRLLVPKHPAPR